MALSMRRASFSAAPLVLLLLGIPADSKVTTLTDEDFEHLTQASTGATTGDWFVKFYAPWCGHCRSMEKSWEKLGERLREEGSYVNIAKVDGTTEKATTRRFDVRGFPTLLFLTHGKMKKYDGRRSEEELYKWATEGHRSKAGEEVPGPPGLIAELFSKFEAKVEAFITQNRQVSKLMKDVEVYMDKHRMVADKTTNQMIWVVGASLVISVSLGLVTIIGTLSFSFLYDWLCAACRKKDKEKAA
eukprot:TRINITY_DN5547_c0_g2_i2.p1 TRINITY_DN5547_c0_g2~~TRINITY_DN5547_c0_g2_i2.p1  ORF type:complete len:244 (+),score=65.17 TRINITY_DN5547_c0_g2_i2:385-1116(+)